MNLKNIPTRYLATLRTSSAQDGAAQARAVVAGQAEGVHRDVTAPPLRCMRRSLAAWQLHNSLDQLRVMTFLCMFSYDSFKHFFLEISGILHQYIYKHNYHIDFSLVVLEIENEGILNEYWS